jgi:putative DNA primase/helicase
VPNVPRPEERDGKPTKVPYDARTGARADTTDPSTWCDYLTAVNAAKDHAGIGCVIAPPYCAVDLDKCRNPKSGETEPWADAIISEVNSYTELSPSGTGFHLWVRSDLPQGRRRAGRVEMYDSGRYFTITGLHVAGTPLTVEARDLQSLQSRLETLDPKYRTPSETKSPDIYPSSSSGCKFDELMAGRWEGLGYASQSEADEALCVLLALKHGGDRSIVESEFNKSGLAARSKWQERPDYRKTTIDRAIQLQRNSVHGVPAAQNTIVEETAESEVPPQGVPIYPAETIDGDHIGELTRMLTNGTPIPPQFVRETCKTILGAIIDGHVGFPGQQDLHMRQYNVIVSVHPRTGKGESWKRTGENTSGMLASLLSEYGVQVVDGGLFGSGEFMVKALKECAARVQQSDPSKRVDVLARFDEMAEPFEKAKATGSTLETKLLQLYERNAIAQGSFKNGQYEVQGIHFSLSGDFTRDGFHNAFAGRGSRGSGFLSRCVFSYAERTTHDGDWAAIDLIGAMKAMKEIEDCVNALNHSAMSNRERFVPKETDAANKMRWEFFRTLGQQDLRYTPELEAHFKRDLLMRVVFSENQWIDETRTQKAIQWTSHQLDVRRALWPEDAGSPVEMMEQRILKALTGKTLPLPRLIDWCNVNRPGSGGRDVFNRAIRALLASGDVWVIGKTQRGSPIYARCI